MNRCNSFWPSAAFNADKPFDQLIREHLAGNLLPATDPRRQAELQIGTGFLVVGPKSYIEKNKLQFQMDVADEQIEATTQAFLGPHRGLCSLS